MLVPGAALTQRQLESGNVHPEKINMWWLVTQICRCSFSEWKDLMCCVDFQEISK